MRLRVGIVGLGAEWESRHAPALHALKDRFEVKAICDPVAHRAEVAARPWNAQAVHGFRELSARGDIDAVMALSTGWFGALPIFAACQAGKALFCAGPLDLDAAMAQQIRERVSRAGIAFMAAFSLRVAPVTLRLKELIATRLGEPRMLLVNQQRPVPTGRCFHGDWRRAIMIEAIDWCNYLVGMQPRSVFSMNSCFPEEQRRMCESLWLTYRDSPESDANCRLSAEIRYSQILPAAWQEAFTYRVPADLQIVCEKGTAYVDLPDRLTWFDNAGQHTELLDKDRPIGEQLLLNFHRAVTSLVWNAAGLEDAYRVISILAAAQESQLAKRVILLDDSAR